MKLLSLLSITVLLAFCNAPRQDIDLLITNGTVYTVDDHFTKTEAIAVNEGKIVATGSTSDLEKKYNAKEVVNADGKFIYPGFIDAHIHFVQYGQFLEQVDLVGTESWNDVVERVKTFAQAHPEGWITGYGWDQNDWAVKDFPDNKELNRLFPDRAVLLERIDGHAAIANQKALELSNVRPGRSLEGGTVETKNGQLTGILIDNAMDLVRSHIPETTPALLTEAILAAQKNCFARGLTSVQDCGLSYKTAELIDQLQQSDRLKMKVYVLLSDAAENYNWLFKKGKVKTDRLSIRGFKAFSDGALGSRGACLLQPYSDRPEWDGFLLSSPEHFDSIAKIIYEHDFQLCTHAIGDSANRTILNIYAKYLNGKNDKRWRIEHSQIINKDDFHLFGDNSIIPSVQPTHATSDMYWAGDRLGKERLKGAYANKELMEQNGWLPFGTDAPVEDISPIKTFYAAVFRKDAKGFPEGGFQMENAVSREDALRGMTIWAAKAAFEEDEKGSIEPGKFADFVVMDTDLLQAEESKILDSKVEMTFVNGEKVF